MTKEFIGKYLGLFWEQGSLQRWSLQPAASSISSCNGMYGITVT